MDSFCRELPKIELHAHLNGCLSQATLKRLGCLDDSFFQYQKADTDIKEVFKQFQVAHKATSTKENLYIATQSVIEDFAEDNVVYLELRTTPRKEEGMSEEDYIETVVKAILDNDSDKIIVKLLLCLDRRMSYECQGRILDIIIKYKKLYPDVVRGIDLCGDPAKGTFFSDLFEKAKENGLFTTVHCAEIKNDEEVKCILNFKPDRIGHGTVLHPSYEGTPENWELYKKLNIPLECCLTSNVICLTSKSYKDHHVQKWIKNSLPFCLSTDDSGVMNTTLSKEFHYVHTLFNLEKSDLYKISRNSIEYSFATTEEKNILRTKLELWKNKHI